MRAFRRECRCVLLVLISNANRRSAWQGDSVYLRCNTYTRVKGGYARGVPPGRGTYILRWRRAHRVRFVLRPVLDESVESYLSRPDPPWVWYHLPTEIMVSAPWTLIPAGTAYSYIIFAREISGPSRGAHVCAHPQCARKESARYCNWGGNLSCAAATFFLLGERDKYRRVKRCRPRLIKYGWGRR